MASESLELRRAVAADAAAIRELTREAYAKWVPVIGREPKPMTADYAEALRKNRFDLLFLKEGWPPSSRRSRKPTVSSSKTSPFRLPCKAVASGGN